MTKILPALGFALDALDFRGDRRWLASVVSDHAHRPLVARSALDGSTQDVVSAQLRLQLQGAMVFVDKLRVAVSSPLVLVESGQAAMVSGVDYPAPGAGVGDPALGAFTKSSSPREALIGGHYGNGNGIANVNLMPPVL
jgi:hypothetical protein